MPMLKTISARQGRTCEEIRAYLECDKRTGEIRARDVYLQNIPVQEWGAQMDSDRELFAQRAGRKTGRKATRPYYHFVLSPSIEDDVSVDDCMAYAKEWLQENFPPDHFQAAVVIHDDNKRRIADGGTGIVHAHIIVNPTCISNGHRIQIVRGTGRRDKIEAGVFGPEFVHEDALADSAQRLAVERGWDAFDNEGRSYKRTHKAQASLEKSRESLYRVLNPLHIFNSDEAFADIKISSSLKDAFLNCRSVFANTQAHNLEDNLTSTEVSLRSRGAYCWKDSIRSRVESAAVRSRSMREFHYRMNQAHVRVEEWGGGLVYKDEDGHVVRDSMLGPAYIEDAVKSKLMKTSWVEEAKKIAEEESEKKEILIQQTIVYSRMIAVDDSRHKDIRHELRLISELEMFLTEEGIRSWADLDALESDVKAMGTELSRELRKLGRKLDRTRPRGGGADQPAVPQEASGVRGSGAAIARCPHSARQSALGSRANRAARSARGGVAR